MFNWFRRRGEPPRPPKNTAARGAPHPQQPAFAASRPARRSAEAAAAPLPEVVAEGNTEADWSVWEDSKTAWDSQLQGIMPTDRIYVRETRPSQLDELDAFAKVGRKRDI